MYCVWVSEGALCSGCLAPVMPPQQDESEAGTGPVCRWVFILAPRPLTAKVLRVYRRNEVSESLAAKDSGASVTVALCGVQG